MAYSPAISVPSKCANIFRALHQNSTCRVKTTNSATNDVDIVTGVRQGRILSPFLLTIVIDFVTRKSVVWGNLGIKWGGARLAELDCADDLARLSHTRGALQGLTNNLHEKGEKVRLRISREKTKAQTVARDQNLPPIIVGEQGIEYVENFMYLGSNISNSGEAGKDVQTRIGKAAGVSGRLVRAIITPMNTAD